jgi:hypothetical protein
MVMITIKEGEKNSHGSEEKGDVYLIEEELKEESSSEVRKESST